MGRFFVAFALTAFLVAGCDNNSPEAITDDIAQPDNVVTDIILPDTDNYNGPDDIGAMVEVPAGEFGMGCHDTDCGDAEKPYHAVTLSAYKIGKYEVTVGEYQKCVTGGICNNNRATEPHYYTNTDSEYYEHCNLGAEGKENHPMQCVTWYGAKAYCEWIGGRLPTEAEWEKAARGTDGQKYPWGDEEATCDYAVMATKISGSYDYDYGCGTGGTMVVGSKPSGISPYGAYDMIGNVKEWVNDWYDPSYYLISPDENPAGPEFPSSHNRVLRGGSWNLTDFYLRASNRYSNGPDHHNDYDGFRCAK